MYAIFEVSTGRFQIGQSEWLAFAGKGPGRNNPLMEDVRNVGPLPRGEYAVRLEAHSRFHAPAFRLLPEQQPMYGRSGFWIHGGTESHGCIILPLVARRLIASRGVKSVYVVHRISPQGVDLISDAQLTGTSGR